MSEKKFIPRLGERVPELVFTTTQGTLRLYNILRKGLWVLIFSHPAPFTPVCTSEFIEFAKMYEEFSKRGIFLLGLSVGSVESQLAWIRSIKEKFNIEIPFPVIADYDMSISTIFNMYHPKEYELGAIRATVLIDDKGIIRFISYYPNEIGRSVKEILRVIDALKYAKEHNVLIPAEWRPGDKVLAHAPTSSKEIEERLRSKEYECVDWYFCYVTK